MAAAFKHFWNPASGGATFIAANAAGLTFEAECVDIKTHQTASGTDFTTINPRGNIPTIILKDGTILSETAACLVFVAELAAKEGKGKTRLAPDHGTTEWYSFINQLSFIATELHKGVFAQLCIHDIPADVKESVIRNQVFPKAMRNLESILGRNNFLGGSELDAADIYAHAVLSWCPLGGLSLDSYPAIKAYFERLNGHPVITEGHKAMMACKEKEQEQVKGKGGLEEPTRKGMPEGGQSTAEHGQEKLHKEQAAGAEGHHEKQQMRAQTQGQQGQPAEEMAE